MNQISSEKRKRRFWRDRPLVLALSVLVLVLGIVGTTLGYLFTKTDSITNTFTPTEAKITVDEKKDNGVKSNVKVTNNSDFEVYIRARVVVTWKDEAGNVYPQAPVEGENDDYTITWTPAGSGTTTNWLKYEDGNWYYTVPVNAKDSTAVLFTNCKPVEGKAPEGYHLSVEILADAIQAKPASAVQEAWGVTISNGSVIAVDSNTNAGGIGE